MNKTYRLLPVSLTAALAMMALPVVANAAEPNAATPPAAGQTEYKVTVSPAAPAVVPPAEKVAAPTVVVPIIVVPVTSTTVPPQPMPKIALAAPTPANGMEARKMRMPWREQTSNVVWDSAQHNGHYKGTTWMRGPPSAAEAGMSDVVLGYSPWVIGQELGYYHDRYLVVNYKTLKRHHPLRGYHWVRDERGDALLVTDSTLRIVDIIINKS